MHDRDSDELKEGECGRRIWSLKVTVTRADWELVPVVSVQGGCWPGHGTGPEVPAFCLGVGQSVVITEVLFAIRVMSREYFGKYSEF